MKRIISFYVYFAMCMVLFAQATDLTLDCQTPGWLSSMITYGDQQTVKNLKVTGYINNTDLKFIGSLTQLNLNGVIDLGDVTIVGNSWNGNFKSASSASSTTSGDEYPYSIQKLIVPHSLTSYHEVSVYNTTIDTLIFDTKVNKIGWIDSMHTQRRYTFYRQSINYLILGENVDSIMAMQSGRIKQVRLPLSLKYVDHYACKDCIKDFSTSNIDKLKNIEVVGYQSFYSESSESLPDTLYFPNILEFNFAAFNYKEGMHIYLGENLKSVNSQPANLTWSWYPSAKDVTFHLASKTYITHFGTLPNLPPETKIYVPKGTLEQWKNRKDFTFYEEPVPLKGIALNTNEIAIEVGEETTLTATPVPEYTFSGWSEVPATMPAEDVTVTGSFSVNKYTLTYTVDGEVYKTYEVEYGTGIEAEAEPEKEGYTFSGWSEVPATMPAHDVTVTGSYTLVDGIQDIMEDEQGAEIYTINGIQIKNLQKGLNIIRTNTGNVKKVFVK